MEKLIAFGMPGGFELFVILAILILIFGKKIPSIARGMGQSIFEFKKGLKEAKECKDDLEKEAKEAVGLDDILG